MELESIISAPIFKNGKFVGFIDVSDIALFLIGLFPKDVNFENMSEGDWVEVTQRGNLFQECTADDVLGRFPSRFSGCLTFRIEFAAQIHSEYETVFPVKKDTPIPKLMEMFYEGVHRVPVLTEDGTLINVISQSDLLAILAQCVNFLKLYVFNHFQ